MYNDPLQPTFDRVHFSILMGREFKGDFYGV